MNKLFTKVIGLSLGLAMTLGIGVAAGVSAKDIVPVYAANTTDTLTITGASSGNNAPWGKSYGNGSGTSTTSNNISIGISYTQVGRMSSTIQIAKGTSNGFNSTGTTGDYISNVELNVKTNSATLSMSTDGSSWKSASAGNFTEAQGYKYFKVNATSKYTQITSIVVTYTTKETVPDVDDWELTTGSLTIETNPTITTYYSDDDSSDIDLTGASIKANYWSASDHAITKSEDVTNNVTAVLDLENKAINLSYIFGEKTQTGSIAITVDSGTRPLFEEIETFNSISGTIDTHISYKAAQGNATTAPAVNSGEIRVYQNGGLFTVSSDEDTRITEIILGSSMATTVTYSVDKGSASSSNSISANGKLTVDSLEASSVQFTCTGTTSSARLYVNYLKVTYKLVEKVIPTKAVVSFNSGKGTYYNGDRTTTNTFSTKDITVVTYDASDNIAKSYGSGIGYKVTINGNTLDATSEVKTLSFAGVTANSYVISVVVEGVGADGANVDNSTQSPAVSVVVNNKTPVTYEWTEAQTTDFYAHRDIFKIDGILKVTFNDTSYTTGMNNYNSAIRAYDESAANHAGEVVILPIHNDGTLNVASETKYVLDMWHKDYENGLHNYTEFTVRIPTLTISDNYTGTYYVGATRALDVTVTAEFESGTKQVLDNSQYELRIGGSTVTSVKPTSTDSINVTATWIIDEVDVLTSSVLVINPEVSTRTLNEIAVSDQILSAGSYFVLSDSAIILDATEGGVDDLVELDQGLVTITKGGKTYTSTDRIKKSDAGTYTVTYSEGGDNTVSTTFSLTVTDAVVSELSSTTSYVYNKISSINDLTSGAKYLVVCENQGVALNGASNTITGDNDTEVTISNSKIVGTDTLNNAVVTIASKTGGYSMTTEDGTYLGHSGTSNSLNTSSTDKFTLTISFDNSGNAVIGCNDRVLRRNSSSNQFRFYTSGQKAIQLYKQAEGTIYSGNKVAYLESVIDAYRLNSGTEGSVCNADSGLYSSDDWTKAKAVYAQLTTEEISQFNTDVDYFSAENCSYKETFDMLLSKDPAIQNQSSKGIFGFISGDSVDTTALIFVAVSLASSTAVGGYFFIRRRKEQ